MEHEEALRARLSALGIADRAARSLIDAPLTDVTRLGPEQITLTTHVETRAATRRTRPMPASASLAPRPVEVWEVPLEPRPGLPAHHTANTGVIRCTSCRSGRQNCQCSSRGTPLSECRACGGVGRITCPDCLGSTVVETYLRITATSSETTLARAVESPEAASLPDDVFLALGDASLGGTLLHRQEEPRIRSLNRAVAGYRSASASDPLARVVEEMLREVDDPHPARIRKQVLEIRRIDAFRATGPQGATLFVYGDPPRLWMERNRAQRWPARLFARARQLVGL